MGQGGDVVVVAEELECQLDHAVEVEVKDGLKRQSG